MKTATKPPARISKVTNHNTCQLLRVKAREFPVRAFVANFKSGLRPKTNEGLTARQTRCRLQFSQCKEADLTHSQVYGRADC